MPPAGHSPCLAVHANLAGQACTALPFAMHSPISQIRSQYRIKADSGIAAPARHLQSSNPEARTTQQYQDNFAVSLMDQLMDGTAVKSEHSRQQCARPKGSKSRQAVASRENEARANGLRDEWYSFYTADGTRTGNAGHVRPSHATIMPHIEAIPGLDWQGFLRRLRNKCGLAMLADGASVNLCFCKVA